MKQGKIRLFALLTCLIVAAIGAACAGCGKSKSYVINFNSLGGGEVSSVEYVPDETKLSLPAPQQGDMYGFRFVGWYYDENCSDDKKVDPKNFDLSYANEENAITLYAKWSDVYTISFQTEVSDEYIPKMEYRFSQTVSLADLPVPRALVRGGITAPFAYWKNLGTDAAVDKDFKMKPQDVILSAVYDTGMSPSFTLDEKGFVSNRPGSKVYSNFRGEYNEETGTYDSARLTDGKALSFDFTFSFDGYGQDAGAVFSASEYTSAGFSADALYFYVTNASALTQVNFGSIDVWNNEGKRVKIFKISDATFADSPYLAKLDHCRETGEETTFTYTVRKHGNAFIFGVDGIEYCSLEVEEDRSEANIAGIVSKCDQVYYKNIAIVEADKAEIAFDAGEGATLDETVRKVEWNAEIGELPVPVREGFVFNGWYYLDGTTYRQLEKTSSFGSDVWKMTVYAEWDDPTAQHYNIEYNTGESGYAVPSTLGWFEGKRFTLPSLSRYMFYTFDGNWYYDAEFTSAVDPSAISVETATGDGEVKTITLYAKATYNKFTNENWTETDGNITGSGETYVDGATVKVGETLSVDVTLPVYSTKYAGTNILFGSSDLRTSPYRVTIVGNDNKKDSGAHGAVQIYKFNGAKFVIATDSFRRKGNSWEPANSTRRYEYSLEGSSYNTGYDAYMNSNGTFTFTVSIRVTATEFYVFINGTPLYRVSTSLAGSKVGLSLGTANTSSYSNFVSAANAALITFDPAGGTMNDSDKTAIVATGAQLGVYPIPTKEGYRFEGWFDGANAVNNTAVFGAEVMTKTLVAHWIEQITVSLDADGGTIPSGSQTSFTIDKGATVANLPTPVKAGYRFDGWLNGTEKVTDQTTFDASVTLKAKWVKQITITFNPDGGELADNEKTRVIDENTAIGSLPQPTRAEFAFVDWYDGDEKVTTATIFSTDKTLVAHWESAPTKTVITVNYNDGGVTPDGTITIDFNTAIGDKLPAAPTREGYRFDKWTKNSNGDEVTASTVFPTATETIIAQWIAVSKVTFVANGGTLTETDRTIDSGSALGALPTITPPAGDELIGWFDSDGTKYTEECVISADVTLTARFGWNGTTVATSLSGDGSEASPYLIGNGAELKYLSVNYATLHGASKYFKLTADINLNEKAWTPIGTVASPFKGVFVGNNKAVTGMVVNGASGLGLFGAVAESTIENLTVEGNVTATGGVVGILTGQIQCGSTIENVTTDGTVTGGATDVGGIAGNVLKGTYTGASTAMVTIKNCTNNATVTCNLVGKTACAGGIVGATTPAVTITGCVNRGHITSKGNFVGGIAGLPRKITASVIENCKNFGNIDGKTGTGGIVGGDRVLVKTSYCYKNALINEQAAGEYNLVGNTTKSPTSGAVSIGSIIGQLDDANGGTIDEASCGLCDADGNPIPANA